MDHVHKLDYSPTVASSDTSYVLKLSIIFAKNPTYTVGMSCGQQDDDADCLWEEDTASPDFIHVFAFGEWPGINELMRGHLPPLS